MQSQMRRKKSTKRSQDRLSAFFVFTTFFTFFCACTKEVGPRNNTRESVTVAQSLGLLTQGESLPVSKTWSTQREYVAQFETAEEAAAHRRAVERQGGRTEPLDSQRRIMKATLDESALEAVLVSSSALLMNDSTWGIVGSKALPAAEGFENEPDFAENLVTTRDVTGVTELLKRFPEADGRGKIVAVLDTGIEFSAAGISTFADGSQKVLGHYDLTSFGQVNLKETEPGELPENVEIGGRNYVVSEQIRAALGSGSSNLLATGELSEAKLAEESREPAGVDLNGNGKTSDIFAVALVENSAKSLFVLLDGDLNGSFANPRTDLLTDFNSTFRSVDLHHGEGGSGEALAVSIVTKTELQFHTILGGHGTSCAAIVAGNKYLNGKVNGLVPQANLLSFVIDATGRDVYKASTLLKTFLMAKEKGADAISVSWGFATSDTESARRFADILDTEIASRGVVMGFAAGNAGPGSLSANSDDYIPRLGFGIGAAISEVQAKNVYNWLGVQGDHVVHYSSVGPTLGGRAIPDLISPLMTLVRSERTGEPGQYVPFGGTSSATPAFIGSVTALLAAIDSQGLPRNMLVMKEALLSSARSLTNVPRARQGMGMVDVNKAYDLYTRLLASTVAGDATEYALQAQVQHSGSNSAAWGVAAQATEGIVLRARAAVAGEWAAPLPPLVKVNLVVESPEEFSGRDTFVEQLNIETDRLASRPGSAEAAWLETPDLVTVQATGGQFPVRFNAAAMKAPGLYRSEIRLVDARGIIKLRIPVHIEIPFTVDARGSLAQWHGSLSPFHVESIPFRLDEAGPLNVKAAVLGAGDFAGGTFVVTAYDDRGAKVLERSVKLDGPTATLDTDTPSLPAGHYEFQLFQRTGAVPSVVNLSFGAERLPFGLTSETAPVGQPAAGQSDLFINIHNLRSRNINKVKVRILGQIRQTELFPTSQRILAEDGGLLLDSRHDLDAEQGFPAFRGLFRLSGNESWQKWQAAIVQSALARERKTLHELAVSFSAVEKDTFRPLVWDWMPISQYFVGSLFDGMFQAFQTSVETGADTVLVEAYPNVGDWQTLKNERIFAVVRSHWQRAQEVVQTRETEMADDWLLSAMRLPAAEEGVQGFYGDVTLYQNDVKMGLLPISARACPACELLE